jgi:sulfofructosephosphate aldolase
VTTLDALARASGTFLMVAMDQRESLRTMLAEHGHPATDDRLAAFKVAVSRELSPHASALLVDSEYGWFERLIDDGLVAQGCGLIMAVDALDQQPGGIVEDTSLDRDVDVAAAAARGVHALKLLVIWRDDDRRRERVELSQAFAQLAQEHGLLGVLEPVVRVPEQEREEAIVAAAAELSVTGCDLYKCQVPLGGKGDPAEITHWARAIDAVTACPWVVLSQGVDPADFPAAVEAACKGGASGMLAGRAVWTATLDAEDPTELLRGVSVPRLAELGAIVDTHARPWQDKAA